MIMMHIPGVAISMDDENRDVVKNENTKYEELKQNKIGSDDYTARGSQTMNFNMKSKEVSYKGY